VVLTEADEIDAQLIGEHGLVNDVADDLGLRKRATVGVAGDVADVSSPSSRYGFMVWRCRLWVLPYQSVRVISSSRATFDDA
jgi:hypothetical protein